MNFLDTPHKYTRDARTSRDVCREACAIEGPRPRKRTPWHERALYIVGAIALAVVWWYR